MTKVHGLENFCPNSDIIVLMNAHHELLIYQVSQLRMRRYLLDKCLNPLMLVEDNK